MSDGGALLRGPNFLDALFFTDTFCCKQWLSDRTGLALKRNGAGSQTERVWLSNGTSRGQDSRLFGLVDDGAARRG